MFWPLFALFARLKMNGHTNFAVKLESELATLTTETRATRELLGSISICN